MAAALQSAGPDFAAAFERFGAGRSDSEALAQARMLALRRLQRLGGLPTARQESWRFTDLSALNVDRLLPAAVDDTPLTAADRLPAPLNEAVRLVFINGRYTAGLSDNPTADGGAAVILPLSEAPGELWESRLASLDGLQQHPMAALNEAFFSDGTLLYLPPGSTLATPIQLVYHHAGGGVYPRTLVLLGEGAELTLVEEFSGEQKGDPCCPLTDVVMAPGAVCRYHRVQQAAGIHLGGLRLTLDSDARFTGHCVSLTGQLNRVDIEARLNGTGADCELRGLTLVDDQQLGDFHVSAVHQQPGGSSRQIFRSVLRGKSRAVFDGLIKVVEAAQQTDASQNNRSLLLSPRAVANAMPRLEILADDVQCAHGATVGFLDPDALFYLRSRGLGEDQARALLINAFAAEQLEAIALAPLRERLEQQLAARFGDPLDQ